MRYALIDNGIVANVIWLNKENAGEFVNAVSLGNRPVAIGDSYENGLFTRGGDPVLTAEEQLPVAINTISELDAALLDATYENITGGLET